MLGESAMRNSSSAESTNSFAIGNFAIMSEGDDLNGDDSLVDITIDADNVDEKICKENLEKEVEEASSVNEIEVKPLTDVNVKLENIKPGIYFYYLNGIDWLINKKMFQEQYHR